MSPHDRLDIALIITGALLIALGLLHRRSNHIQRTRRPGYIDTLDLRHPGRMPIPTEIRSERAVEAHARAQSPAPAGRPLKWSAADAERVVMALARVRERFPDHIVCLAYSQEEADRYRGRSASAGRDVLVVMAEDLRRGVLPERRSEESVSVFSARELLEERDSAKKSAVLSIPWNTNPFDQGPMITVSGSWGTLTAPAKSIHWDQFFGIERERPLDWAGMPVRIDETLEPGTAEIRDRDGTLYKITGVSADRAAAIERQGFEVLPRQPRHKMVPPGNLGWNVELRLVDEKTGDVARDWWKPERLEVVPVGPGQRVDWRPELADRIHPSAKYAKYTAAVDDVRRHVQQELSEQELARQHAQQQLDQLPPSLRKSGLSAHLEQATGDDKVTCGCGHETSVAMIGKHLEDVHGIDPQAIADAPIVDGSDRTYEDMHASHQHSLGRVFFCPTCKQGIAAGLERGPDQLPRALDARGLDPWPDRRPTAVVIQTDTVANETYVVVVRDGVRLLTLGPAHVGLALEDALGTTGLGSRQFGGDAA